MGECSVWLLPVDSESQELATVIHRLSTRTDAPRFRPHLTLLGPVPQRAEHVCHILSGCHVDLPVQLPAVGVEHGDERFHALFVRLRETQALAVVRSSVARHLSALPPIAVHEPHVSLAYPRAALPPAWRQAVCASVAIRSTYTFDRLAVVEPGNLHEGWDDVEAWQVLDVAP